MQLRSVIAVISLAALAFATGVPAPNALAQGVDRPAEIRGGTCAALGEVVTTLANLVFTEGQIQGQAAAQPVEQSGTVVPFQLADFLSADHAIVVLRSPEDSSIVACGDIGGALNPDGTMAIGMIGMNGSGLSGIAYFTPIIEFDNMLVTILLVSNDPAAVPAVVEEVNAVPASDGTTDIAGLEKSNVVVSTDEGIAGDGSGAEEEDAIE
jgi:hypothetical protein